MSRMSHRVHLLFISLTPMSVLGIIPPINLLAGSGIKRSVDGVGLNASFDTPLSVAVSHTNLYALVTERAKVRQVFFPSGNVTTLAGSDLQGYSDGAGSRARFFRPIGVAITKRNIAYIADWNLNASNHKIRILDIVSKGVTTLQLTGDVKLKGPSGLALKNDDSILYIADTWWVLQVDLTSGTIAWLTGSGYSIAYQDGIGREAYFVNLVGLAMGPDESYILVVDSNFPGSSQEQQSNAVRLIHVDTREVVTVSGGIERGFSDGLGTNARFDQPAGIALDQTTSFALIADYGNQRLRSFDLVSRAVLTLAGSSPPIPAVSARRTSQGNAIAITTDGLNVIMTNVTDNSVNIIRCPSGDCETNHYKSPCRITSQAGGDGRCIRCPNNTVSRRGSTSQFDCACDLGLYGPATACALCPEGKFKDFSTIVSQGELDCLPCNLTGLSSLPGSRSKMNCTQCARGYHRQMNACAPCPNNSSKNTIGDFECSRCPQGSTATLGSITCTCSASMIMENNSVCVCNAGFFGRAGGPCFVCPAGKYKNSTGSDCSLCPANTYSEPAQPGCVCNAGFFAAPAQDSSMSCLTCTNGTYKDISGNQGCIPCRQFESGICKNPSSLVPNSTNTTLDSSMFFESSAPFLHALLFSSSVQGGLFWLSCTPLMDGQCLRCPSVQLDAIPGLVGISACSCREGLYAVSVQESLKSLFSLSVSSSTNQSFFLSELNRTQAYLAGKEICRTCPNGTFKGFIGPGPCSPCPLHSTSNNKSLDVTSCVCNAGFYKEWHGRQNFTCESCPMGYFKDKIGDLNCSSCPSGKSTRYSGAIHILECSCTHGHYQKSSGNTFCNKCERGRFKNFTGNDLCSLCPEGFYQDQLGTSVCKSCAAGTYHGKIGQKKECACVACPQNTTTKSSASTDILQCMCMAGYFGRPEAIKGNGSCTMCPAGSAKTSIGFSDTCDVCSDFDNKSTTKPTKENPPVSCLCGVGWTGPDYGPCEPCLRGTYKDILGSGNCKNCLANHYSDDYLSTCTPCPDNSILLDLKGDVLDCECKAGFFANESWCVQCDPGTFKSSIGFEICYDCQQGKYSDYSSTFCHECPMHTTSPNRSESVYNCTCDAGFTIDLTVESSQLVCIPCSAGKYKSAPGFLNCTENPPNSDSEEGAPIFTCNSGFAVNREANGCTPCESFYQKNAVSGKPFCEMTEYFLSQRCSCVACPIHSMAYESARFDWYGEVNISGAEPGINGDLAGALSVKDCVCQVGYTCAACPFCEACDACVPCDVGTYKDYLGNFPCSSCPTEGNSSVQLTSLPASFDVTNCTCPPGFRVLDQFPDLQCSACEPGTYSTVLGSLACFLCPIQKTSTSGSSACVDCQKGDVCVCDVGFTLNTGEGLLCIPCAQGKYKNAIGSQACTPCSPSLRFQAHEGKTSCQSCTPTRRCPNGMYWKTCLADQDGSCVPCLNPIPFNADYSGPGFPLNTSMCPWKCANGFQLTVENKCEACPQGKFKGPAQSSCTTCPHFSTTLLEGEKSCTKCFDGYYLSGFSESGHVICRQCSALHTSVQSSSYMGGSYFSDACTCKPGFFGCSWNCSECPPGTYKNSNSVLSDDNCMQDQCVDCPEGKFNPVSGQSAASSCRECDPGSTLGALSNRTRCDCPVGSYFLPETGQCIYVNIWQESLL